LSDKVLQLGIEEDVRGPTERGDSDEVNVGEP